MNDNVKPSKSGKYIDIDTWDALKAQGYTEDDLLADQPFGPMISSYTRQQAIDDGVLVDMAADGDIKAMVAEAGFRMPLVLTSAAFHDTVLAGTTETPEGEFVFPSGQSCKGRLWDVLMVLKYSIRGLPDGEDRVNFSVDVDTHGDGRHTTVKLWCLCGPGDDGEAVLTVMLEGED